tara:strand:+ start:6751 stop:7347 length:597 start_codon:yes stop_codon:yes gene_type:complete
MAAPGPRSGGPRDFAVSDFMSKLDGLSSYAKRNRFTVEIIPPTTLNSDVTASSIEFLVKGVSFPAASFGATNYRSGGKFALEVPYERTEEPVTITFLGTNDWTPRKFWYDWIEHIQSTETYNMTYYKNFVGSCSISVYSEQADQAGGGQVGSGPKSPTHKVKLHECWPKALGAIELGWESGELVDFTVDLQYSWWTQE